MNMSILEWKIINLENEIHKIKMILHDKKKQKNKGIASLCGVLKGKTDLSLEEIQKFKYKVKDI